jgi:catechol 2,3-dioxygenase-like lactoylglutathione lyase family enzyme
MRSMAAADPRIEEVALGASAALLDPLGRFYGDALGLPVARADGRLDVSIGAGRLRFTATTESEPFHHFALLVPGDRFDAAHAWLAERAELLPRSGTDGDTVFPFDAWDALACYCHDPAGNIVELIAHGGIGDGAFAGGRDLLGISEIGLVTPQPRAAAEALHDELGLELWSGEAGDDADTLGFVGRQAHTLIICRPGRGWLPTGRPAQEHPVDVTFAGASRAIALPGTRHTVRA